MSKQTSKAENKGADKAKANPFEDLDKLKTRFEKEENLRSFFQSLSNERYHYIDFVEFREIFGDPIDLKTLGRVKKYWAEVNTEYFNLCYDNLWYYKWTPVFLRFLYKGMQGRIMSLFWLAAYLEGFDYFMEPIFLHYYKSYRMIKLNDAFDYHLTKEQYIKQRYDWFVNYLEILKENITDGVALKPAAKYYIDRVNRKPKENLFSDVDDLSAQSKDILFKEEIATIKRKGIEAYVKNKIQTLDVPGMINNLVDEFKKNYLEYKLEYYEFPTREDFNAYLHAKFLPASRLLSYEEEWNNKVKRVAQTFDYAFDTNVERVLRTYGFIKEEEIQRKYKKKLRLKTNYADFFLFSAVFILPFRIVSLARSWKTIRYKF